MPQDELPHVGPDEAWCPASAEGRRNVARQVARVWQPQYIVLRHKGEQESGYVLPPGNRAGSQLAAGVAHHPERAGWNRQMTVLARGGMVRLSSRALCNECGDLVPATARDREGKVYLSKDCPTCGVTETLISSDAERYWQKHALDGTHVYSGCGINCLECRRKQAPSFVFCDITNRCNLNCPICINNTPSMGFLFEPPLEYFERIFTELSCQDPRPPVQLFGGEPTVRQDMFEIIAAARSHRLPVRVVTNGIKLADEDYCKRLVDTRSTILLAYDGHKPDTYRELRGSEDMLEAKLKALDNLQQNGARKVGLMTLIAKGLNDDVVGDLLASCHERWSCVRGIYFMPLAQTWDVEDFGLETEQTTCEETENIVRSCFPDDRIEFIPAGVLGELPLLVKCLGVKRPPFSGAHPNCESFYILASNGQEYVPMERYLTCSLSELVRALFSVEQKLAKTQHQLEQGMLGRLLRSQPMRDRYLALHAMGRVVSVVWHHVRIGALLQGRGIAKLWHMLCAATGLILRRKTKPLVKRHFVVQQLLQLIVLPFEDSSTLETDRLERCPNAFVFYDPRTDRVHSVTACAWTRHKARALRGVADHYKKAAAAAEET